MNVEGGHISKYKYLDNSPFKEVEPPVSDFIAHPMVLILDGNS